MGRPERERAASTGAGDHRAAEETRKCLDGESSEDQGVKARSDEAREAEVRCTLVS